MEVNGFEGTDGGAENVSEVSPSIEETGINDSMAEIDLPDLEPVEMQDEINEDAFESNESTYDEVNFDDLVLEEPEIIEEDDGEDDVFGETSSGASKHAIIDALKESEEIEEPEEEIGETEEEPEELQEKVEELKEKSEKSELTEEQEEKLENLEKTAEEEAENLEAEEQRKNAKYLEQTEKETSEVEEKQNEIKENEDIIDEDLKDHLQSEYATYEDNLRFQDELSRQKEELLNSREEITVHKAEIEKMLEDETLTEEQRNELQDSHTALEQQEKDLDAQIEKNSEQMEMLKVEEQEMRNISQYEMQGLNERVNGIVEEFEEQDASYEAAVSGENSEEFVENCNETLNKLNEQKDIVQSARDLKFQEIYEYVTKNEMERFDTEHDPHYQHLISEYRALLQQDEEIRSHVNTIDAQAMTVAYYQELPYDSQANINNPHPFHTSVYSDAELGIAKNIELPKEIAEGNDDPETTDYFVDEVRADKTMEKFCQGNWENFEPDEKKDAIEKLAEYNYDILGIKEPIKIEYYDKNVEGDYGGYDEESNTLFINIRNLQNGPETADTVAHEMRHAYQYMRAGELETNRDLSFAINFSRYIKPEQNQSAYEQQIVEKDAALYAQRFKKYVESLDSTMEKSTDKTVENKADRAKNADYGKAATVDSSKCRIP